VASFTVVVFWVKQILSKHLLQKCPEGKKDIDFQLLQKVCLIILAMSLSATKSVAYFVSFLTSSERNGMMYRK